MPTSQDSSSRGPDRQRVIVVLGIRRVDRKYVEVPPVRTMLSWVLPPVGHGVTCRRNDTVGKSQWQPVVMDHRQDVDAGITRFPEHRLDIGPSAPSCHYRTS